jgi:hypothetical protein
MQRFFFHIEHGELSVDTDGTLLSGMEEARTAAVRLVGELLRDEARQFWEMPQLTVTVEDEDGLALWTIDTTGTASAAAGGPISSERLRPKGPQAA